MNPDASAFGAAQARAFDQTEAHLEVLAAEYDRVVRAAGVRAATAFSELALTAAAGDPPWVVPALDDLIDVTRVTQELLGATKATRTQAAINATRPILSAMGVSFSLEAPMVKDLVSRTGVRAAALSIPGLQDAVRQAVTAAFEQGLSVPQTAALIAQKANGLAAYQSEMLARTDLIGTANGGSLLAAKAVWPEQGTLLKRWTNATNSRTENDGHIRPTHLEANGQLVDIDERFLVGEDELLFPGDPGGTDAEVCNCRCTIVYEEPATTATGWDESKHPRESAGRHEGGRFKGGATVAVDDARMLAWIHDDVEGLRSIVEREDGDRAEEVLADYRRMMVERYHEEYDAGARTIAERLNGLPAVIRASPGDSMAISDPTRHPGGAFTVGLADDSDTYFTVFTGTDGAIEDGGIGDVLDISDSDFFGGDDTSKAGRYVAMLRAVRGDVVTGDSTLYRGMSGAERAAWDAGSVLPPGKFFTSEPTANMAQDIPGEFPELHEFVVSNNDVVETDPGVFQLIRPATLKNGRIAADHGDLTSAAWDEAKHPRHHKGEHEGGRFAGKEAGTPAVRPGYTPARYRGWHDGQMHELWDLWSDTGADAFSPTDNDADPALDSIANMQGFDGLPEVITEEELQRRVRDEGWSIYYRGVSEAKFADAFRNGDYYAGLGVQGNGIYITPVYAVAEEYAQSRAGERGGEGAVIRMIMRPDATKTSFANANQIKRAGHDALINDYRATLPPDLSDNERKIRMNEAVGEGLIPGYRIQSNAGRVAAAEGFDAIDEGDVVTLLNRTAVAVVDEDYVPS